MSFILNLTRREIRSSWRRLLFFFLCIALGVGSIVFLRSLIQNLTKVVGNDARALMTADFEVTSTNTFTPPEIASIDEIVGRYRECGAFAKQINVRTCFHPDQFVVLNSTRPDVVEASIRELEEQYANLLIGSGGTEE